MFHSLPTAFCGDVDAGVCCQALLEGALFRTRVWARVHGTTQKNSSPQAPFRQTPEYCWIDTSGLASNFAVKITVLVFTEWASSHVEATLCALFLQVGSSCLRPGCQNLAFTVSRPVLAVIVVSSIFFSAGPCAVLSCTAMDEILCFKSVGSQESSECNLVCGWILDNVEFVVNRYSWVTGRRDAGAVRLLSSFCHRIKHNTSRQGGRM